MRTVPVITGFFIFIFSPHVLFAESSPVSQKELSKPLPTSFALPASGLVPRYLRIALSVEAPSAILNFEGPFEVSGNDGKNNWKKRVSFPEVKVRSSSQGMEWNSIPEMSGEFLFDGEGKPIRVGQRTYYGVIRVLRKSDSRLTVVNQIELEEYLRGVLPLEVSASWPMEALRAHAVASRTYALFQSLKEEGGAYALRDSVLSQVYGGAASYRPETDQAIRDTRGEILTFRGKIFPAYFHSNCGGRTVQVDLMWNAEPNPALSGVICPFCAGKKYYEWSFEMPLSEIEGKMQAAGFPAKGLSGIEFLDREISGRARQVKLTYARSELVLSGIQFRQILGYDKLRSLKTGVSVENGAVHFHGFGWGHGIGLCQWGANGQAEIGKDYQEILQYYYPGSEIQKITS